MRKHIYISLFLVFMLLLSPAVHAQSETKIGIPIEITTNGTQTTGQISFTSEDSSAPMPTENPITIKGKDNVVLSYTKTGTWKYKITQKAGSDTNTTYDTTLYHLTVFIGYKDGGLYAVVTLYKDGSSEKDGEAVFANTKKENSETPVTPSHSTTETPSNTTPSTTSKTTKPKTNTSNGKTTTKNEAEESSTMSSGSESSSNRNSGTNDDSSTEGSDSDINGSKTGTNGDSTTTGTSGVKTSDPTVIIPYALAVGISFIVLIILLIRTLKQKH